MGNSLTGYTLIVPETKPDGIIKRIANLRDPHYTYVIPENDENSARALEEMRARSLSETADIVRESARKRSLIHQQTEGSNSVLIWLY